ncbi:uncharacterized protein B0T15DRAFT_481111 [Chaetomium strumarium]|uniref:GPI inositol-deacylase n=1 Tax=Chaetomium strumarium TaxID=1170767 RepID=A0AAJ0H0P7_9PEZI|nr:hypothetical protein B0T15DRAFT_481111 [Chaetomium strumarium]
MWKRFKPGRSSNSNDRLDQTSSAPPHLEERSTSAPTGPASDGQRHNSLPHNPTLKVPTDAPLPRRRASALSDVHAKLYSPHQRQRSQDRRDDPLGLLVLHTPPERTIDVIFIHGLGGTSLRTWCRDRDLNKLWPKLWLPDALPTARVLTFGYNAHFASKKEQASSTIGDFANDLLFRMKYGENTAERVGQVPIVVVAHSMGGLVFKKAFVQGHLNNEFSQIVSMIKAVLFLATPHRGTDLAETLNRLLLSASFLGHSPKEYVTELARKSPTIDELNEAFRHHASKLQIFSFYETLATTAGPVSVMVVDKATALMGYPNETPTPLAANHHDVCKFTSTKDPNFTSVIGALRSVARSVVSPTDDHASRKRDLQHLVDLLGVTGPPEEDLSFGRSARKEGTCESFLASDEVDSWFRSKSRRILWTHAQPGGGKSTLCSFVIGRLFDAGHKCSYFFFKYGHRDKQSTSSMLRSLAYQMALQLPEFRRALIGLAESGVRVAQADSATIWEKIFSSALAGIRADEDMCWVIDGLDEAESSKRVVELLSRVAEFESQVRILVFSRPLANINQAFQLARRRLPVVDMPLLDNQNDIRRMVAEEMDYLLSGDNFKAQAVDEIVARSQGNFLWASLVTKHVVKCHREEQVKRVLDSTPNGMHALYDRMADAVINLELEEDKVLARMPVTVEELSEIYPAEMSSIMDLNHTISQVCGQFVVVNSQGRVTLVHHSAREYLKRAKRQLLFTLDPEPANEEIFSKCLATLCDKGLRRKLHMLKVPQFLPYASTSWASHLERSRANSNHVLDALIRFFNGPYPLAWIQYLAMSGRLRELFTASRILTTYSPALIYQCIPALSPVASIIHQRFSENPSATVSVSGLTNEEWNDCLARVSGGSGKALHWSLDFSANNPGEERALELKFDDRDSLMMVSEYRRVYKLTRPNIEESAFWKRQDPDLLDEPGVPEGTFLSTPSCVAFNNDCTQIAVSYRAFPLSIWIVDPPKMIARLRRKSKHGRAVMHSYTGDNKVVWHPSGTMVIGIYGRIFKWSPEEDTYDEIKGETDVVPHGLACSPDGRVFITMDVAGSIKIYAVSSMSLIYRLRSEDRINQILFSPDSVRFYDLRGSYCNVWEPNCLLRLADAASEQTSDTESTADNFWSDTADTLSTSITFPASESQADSSRPAITDVDPGQAPHGLLVAHANADGSINVYDTVSARKHQIDKVMFGMTTLKHLTWSPRLNCLAYSLLNGATTTRSVTVEYTGPRSVSTGPVYSEQGSPAEHGAVLADRQLPEPDEPVKWQQHPSDPEQLICLSAKSATIFSWANLEPNSSPILLALRTNSLPEANHENVSFPALDALLDSHSPRFLLLRTVATHSGRRRYNFAVFPTEHIYYHPPVGSPSHSPATISPTSSASNLPPRAPTETIKPLPIPSTLASTIAHAVGILSDNRLVFLDRQLWKHGQRPSPDVRRHFFLPHDWVTTEGLRLCRLLRDGTLLIPCKGEVAIIRGELVHDY